MTFPKPKTKPVYDIEFEPTREGFRNALSRRESSSNLLLPHNHRINLAAQVSVNRYGFTGYFQFGEDALIDCGYYNPRIRNSDKSKSNNWTGSWTGKNGITSFERFKNSPEVQVNAFEEWVNILCNRMRNKNINEFYGKTINGVEITESGCIAATHLKGAGAVLKYLTSNGLVNGTDAFNTGVAEYIELLAHYDLETCCTRKIYIDVKENGISVANIDVQIETVYPSGIYHNKVGTTQNTYTTNNEGKILVIVRHPGAQIKLTINGKSQTITQEVNRRQSYTIDITGSTIATGVLQPPSTPQPRQVANQTPQDQRRTQNRATPSSIQAPKDITFNISIVEDDTKKVITNMRYYLIYKGNSKEHRTNNQGIETNIVATEGEDIEICVAGRGSLQPIGNFTVQSRHEGKTLKISLPVESFNIKIMNGNGSTINNTRFIVFYRNRSISKTTNSQGLINVRMLVGFVYGVGKVDGRAFPKLCVTAYNPLTGE